MKIPCLQFTLLPFFTHVTKNGANLPASTSFKLFAKCEIIVCALGVSTPCQQKNRSLASFSFLCLSRNDKSWGISDVHANGDPIDDPGQKNGLSETISLWYKMMTCSSLPHSISSVKHSIFKYGHNLLPNISVIVWSRDEWCSVPISYRWLKSNITTSFGWLSRNFLMSSKHGITSAPYRPWIKHTLPDELSLDMRMSKYRIPEFSCCSAVKFCVIDQRYMTSRPGAPNMWTTAWISLDWSGATWECGSRL